MALRLYVCEEVPAFAKGPSVKGTHSRESPLVREVGILGQWKIVHRVRERDVAFAKKNAPGQNLRFKNEG